jgi:AcrR family transcriptional regulator
MVPETDPGSVQIMVESMSSQAQLKASNPEGKPASSDSLWGSDTTGQICAAAICVFYERGYHASTMRDIAEAVGIRAPSIYNHFPHKEALLHHVMIQTLMQLIEQAETSLAEAGDDPVERVSAFVQTHIRFHITFAPEAAVADNELRALGETHRASVIELRDRYEAILREVLNHGIDRGVFAAGEVGLTCIAILTMCTADAIWFREGGPLSVNQVAAAYTDFVLRMIGSN